MPIERRAYAIDFRLVICSNYVSTLHSFGDIASCLANVIDCDLEKSLSSVTTVKVIAHVRFHKRILE